MRAAVLTEFNHDWQFQTLPDPRPAPGQVVIRIRASGMCGTDLHAHHGHLGAKLPIALGHEPAGEIVELGAGVLDLKVGDRVGVFWNQKGCGRCATCQSAGATWKNPSGAGITNVRFGGGPGDGGGGGPQVLASCTVMPDGAVGPSRHARLSTCPGRGTLSRMKPACPVSLVAVTEASRPALANLFQLYVYDWSELLPLDVRYDGRFSDDLFARYATRDEEHHAFLLYAAERLAGFAIVAERSRLTGEVGVCDMEEFFVMRRYRRRGVGRAAAVATFDRFPDRRWEVRQRDGNATATAFWRTVIDGYTGGNYRELPWNDAAWVGPVQTFRRVRATD